MSSDTVSPGKTRTHKTSKSIAVVYEVPSGLVPAEAACRFSEIFRRPHLHLRVEVVKYITDNPGTVIFPGEIRW